MICFKCSQGIKEESPLHGLHPTCFIEWFSLKQSDDFVSIAIAHESPLEQNAFVSSFFHGKFKKYAARLGNIHYILKLSDEYPELAKAEYLCNQIARSLKLDVANHFLIRFMNHADCFVTYNFMQDFEGSDLKHIYHFLGKDDAYTVKNLLKIIETKTGKMSEVRKFIHMCLFDALIGNHDRHGRNLGFIVSAKGYVMAPCYDNPSYLAIEDKFLLAAHHEPRGRIATSRTEEPVMIDYVQEFKELAYRDLVIEFLAHMDLQKIEKIIDQSFLSQKRKKAFTSLMNRRYLELKNEV